MTQKKALMKKIKHFSKPKNDEELRSSKVWTSLRIKDIYPAGQEYEIIVILFILITIARIRYMDEKPIEFKPDPPPPQTQTQSSNSLLERMRTLSQEYIPHDHDDNDSLEEDAQRNIEGKFLFRSRFHHVLETLQRETLPVSPITKKISPSQTQYGTSNHSQFLDNYSHRKSYSVFNEIQVDNPKDTIQSNTNSLSDSVELSRSTFTEDPNHKIALSSPRAAMIMEGHVRYQIPYVIKELVGNVNVEQTSIINLTGQGIGDEKMLCLVQALPYFKNVDEINISSLIFSYSISHFFLP